MSLKLLLVILFVGFVSARYSVFISHLNQHCTSEIEQVFYNLAPGACTAAGTSFFQQDCNATHTITLSCDSAACDSCTVLSATTFGSCLSGFQSGCVEELNTTVEADKLYIDSFNNLECLEPQIVSRIVRYQSEWCVPSQNIKYVCPSSGIASYQMCSNVNSTSCIECDSASETELPETCNNFYTPETNTTLNTTTTAPTETPTTSARIYCGVSQTPTEPVDAPTDVSPTNQVGPAVIPANTPAAPVETQPPQTQAPQTQVPQTQAPQTQTPQTLTPTTARPPSPTTPRPPSPTTPRPPPAPTTPAPSFASSLAVGSFFMICFIALLF